MATDSSNEVPADLRLPAAIDLALVVGIDQCPPRFASRLLDTLRRALRPDGLLRIVVRDAAAHVGTLYRPDRGPTADAPTPGRRVPSPLDRLREYVLPNHAGQPFDRAELQRFARWLGFTTALPAHATAGLHDLDLAAQGVRLDRPTVSIDLAVPRRPRRATTPTVSVMITAWRPTTFPEALLSAQAQSHQDLQIIVRDDSPTDDIQKIAIEAARSDDRIDYERNPQRLGGRANYETTFAAAEGDYVKWLNDDDVLLTDAVERLGACLDIHADVSLATGYRQLTDEAGHPLPSMAANRLMTPMDSIIDGRSAIQAVLRSGVNVIGEPTTTLFRRSDVDLSAGTPFNFCDRVARANGDLTLWMQLLAKGDLAYVTTTVATLRTHPDRATNDPGFRDRALRNWVDLRTDAESAGLFEPTGGVALHATPLLPKPWWSPSVTDAYGRLTQGLPIDHLSVDEVDLDAFAELATNTGDDDVWAAYATALAHNGQRLAAVRVLADVVNRGPHRTQAYLDLAALLAGLDAERAEDALRVGHTAGALTLEEVRGAALSIRERQPNAT